MRKQVASCVLIRGIRPPPVPKRRCSARVLFSRDMRGIRGRGRTRELSRFETVCGGMYERSRCRAVGESIAGSVLKSILEVGPVELESCWGVFPSFASPFIADSWFGQGLRNSGQAPIPASCRGKVPGNLVNLAVRTLKLGKHPVPARLFRQPRRIPWWSLLGYLIQGVFGSLVALRACHDIAVPSQGRGMRVYSKAVDWGKPIPESIRTPGQSLFGRFLI